MGQEQICVGVSVINITPPLEVGLLTSSLKRQYATFKSERMPLKARVLAIKSDGKMVIIVSMDLLALNDTSVGGWENFKKKISSKISPENMIITCTHTHNAPESVALTELYLLDIYKEWLRETQVKLRKSIQAAVNNIHPCNVSIAFSNLENYSLQRRIPTDKGIVLSDSKQPISATLLKRKPVDKRVHVIRFLDPQGQAIATVVHAICHPVHEMCIPHISPDFPGEMCRILDASPENGIPFFWNGAAGDINPPTVSCGPEYAFRHGQALAGLAVDNPDGARLDTFSFNYIRSTIQLTTRKEANVNNARDALARISVLRIGELALVFLPGEPFVDLALEIERKSPFEHTVVIGYAENSIGYIPTYEAFIQGGYEIGPGGWSFLEKKSGSIIVKETLDLLTKIYY